MSGEVVRSECLILLAGCANCFAACTVAYSTSVKPIFSTVPLAASTDGNNVHSEPRKGFSSETPKRKNSKCTLHVLVHDAALAINMQASSKCNKGISTLRYFSTERRQ